MKIDVMYFYLSITIIFVSGFYYFDGLSIINFIFALVICNFNFWLSGVIYRYLESR